ncbi:MAG TPA: flagellar protein FlgN [Spirochaetota bacterium]|nr:flagellar protein FlgN [Spirochaetota bacterium]
MHQNFSRLENILTEEAGLYREIYSLELDKTEAAIEKNGILIQEISAKQEELVCRIESLESVRAELTTFLAGDYGYRRDVTLSEIASRADSETSSRIIKGGAELKELLIKLRNRQDTNIKLLQDNMEFFSILMSDLKNSSSLKSGYGSDGRENNRVVNPVLFNTKA